MKSERFNTVVIGAGQTGLAAAYNLSKANTDSIVWATGYKPDYSWIKFDVTDENGWPKNWRGISEKYQGLYFVGMIFQYGLTSGFVGGVGRDARFVVNHLRKSQIA